MRDRTIGFVGLGIMGLPMCRRLLGGGFSVIGYNRSRRRVDQLVEAGGRPADSPADVARQCDVVISCVTDTPDVEQVALGDGGIIHAAREGLLYIDMSTISPRATRHIADTLGQRGVAMLDAPVSGGEIGAINGTLSIMAGGPRDAFDRARPIFEPMGKTVTHCGPNGSGQSTKLCNQIGCVLNLQALCEALLLATRSGLDPAVMIEAIKNGAAGSWAIANLGPKIVARDFAPGFMIDLQVKDIRLVLEAAAELNLPLPGTALVQQLLLSAQAEGDGRLGTQALIKGLEKLAGVQVGGRQ